MRLFQTRTRVHSPAQAAAQTRVSDAHALKALGGVLLLAQLLLWITFFGYDRAHQAVWQAAALQLLPALLLYAVWKRRDPRAHPAKSLPLLACLYADACFSLLALSGFISQLIPHEPPWVGVAAPVGFVFLTVLWAGMRGVSFGAWALRGLMLLLFIFGTVFLHASNRGDRVFPILGAGVPSTLLAAAHGAGSLWGVALLFLLPKEKARTARYAFLPWGLSVVWALWYAFMRPWAAGDEMAVAEKLMGLARHASSVTLYEMAGLLWMVLLPLSLMGSAACAQVIIRRAFPRCPRFLPPLLLLSLCALPIVLHPSRTLAALETLLPYRAAVSLACGVILMKRGRA